LLFLTAFVIVFVAICLFCFVASMKLAAIVFRRPDLQWKTACLIAGASVVFGGASTFLGHAETILGLNPTVAVALQILTGVASWVLPIIWLKKVLDIRLMRSFGILVIYVIFSVIVASCVAFAVRTFAFHAFKISSGAMLPTLQVGDHLLSNKYVYRFSKPSRGEVIIFKYPQDRSKYFIMRVIAEGGDSIEIHDKQVLLNGEPIDDPWGRHVDPLIIPSGDDQEKKRDNFGPVSVPEGSYFVMGDNRDRSYDSRFWGYVKREDIKAKAFVMYWSEDPEVKNIRWHRLGMQIH
jgi:signal peptidase I